MATRTSKLDVVTTVVDGTDRNIEHSAEELSGAIAKVAAANTTSVALGEDSFHSWVEVTVANAGTDITFPAPFAGKIVDGYVVKIGTSADAGDLMAVSLNGTTILSCGLNVADKTKVTPLIDIDHADNDFAAGDTVTVNPTKSTDCACVVFIGLKRTA